MAFGKPLHETPETEVAAVAEPSRPLKGTERQDSAALPFDTEMQHAVAHHLITDREFYDSARLLGMSPNWFNDPRSQVVVRALFRFAEENGCHPRSADELRTHPVIAHNAEPKSLEVHLERLAVEAKRYTPSVLLGSLESWRKAWLFKEAVARASSAYNQAKFEDAYRIFREGAESVAKASPTLVGFAVPISDVKEESINWVTPGWVVTGKLHLVEGDGGSGKSTITLDAVACWSSGRGWLGGTPRGPAACLILAPEDGAGDTIRPKLKAAGADLSRVYVRTMDAGAPVFPDVIPQLEEFITKHSIRFLIIDSLMSTLGGRDSYKDQEVRDALIPLTAMLERTGCTALAIRHLNKAAGTSAASRGMGSVAFAAIARIVILCGKDPETPGQFVMARSKGNLGRAPQSRSYALKGSTDTSTDVVITWGLHTGLSADDLVAKPANERAPKRSEAEDFLREMLPPGVKVPKAQVVKLAEARGLSKRTIERTAGLLEVVSVDGVWHLPSAMAGKVDAVLAANEAPNA